MTNIDATYGISSFTVVMTMTSGSTTLFDNNGNGYPISDAVILQTPQSCLLQGSGALTVSAVVSSLPLNY